MIEYTLEPNGEKPLGHLPDDSQQLVINATKLMEIFKEKDDKLRCEKKESVFLLDGSWGSGKTTLVKAWREHLKNTDKPAWKTIYIDAYQNDFNDDPLLAIGEEILSLKGDEKKLEDLKKTFLSVWKWARPITRPIIANTVPSGELMNKVLDGLDGFLKERLQTNETFADRIQKFREDLESLAKDGEIVVFVDELDRCRPTYAIEMLEKVKHIFSVNGIVFVLVANSKQLCASLKKVYGGTFNAKEYLQKNIDIHLPMPSIKNYQSQSWVNEFYQTMQKHFGEAYVSKHIISYFASEGYRIPPFTINHHKEIINSLSAARKFSYRQMQKLHIESFLAWKADLQHPFCPVLIYLRSLDNGLYEEIKSESVRKDSFLERIGIDIAKLYKTRLLFCIFALARMIDPDGKKDNKESEEQTDYWDHAVEGGEILGGLPNRGKWDQHGIKFRYAIGEILSNLPNYDSRWFIGLQEEYAKLALRFQILNHLSLIKHDSISQLCNDLDKFQISISTESTS